MFNLEFHDFSGIKSLNVTVFPFVTNVVYYESIKRNLKIKCIYECRCYERLQTKTKEFTRLGYVTIVYYESIKREPKFEKYVVVDVNNRLSPFYSFPKKGNKGLSETKD